MKVPIKETAMALFLGVVLLSLGTWQIFRMEWKNQIIADLDTLYAQETTPRPMNRNIFDSVDRGDERFAYGTFKGQPLKDKAILLGPRTQDGRFGYHLLIPVSDEQQTVIVNAGWVSDLWIDTIQQRLATLPDRITVRGLFRKSDWSGLASKNSPENNLWFRADTKEIAAAKNLINAHEGVLYADSINPPLADVSVQSERWYPRNTHLQYVLFWYGMAFVLALIYGFYLQAYNANKKAP